MDIQNKMASYRANAIAAETLLLREIGQRQLHGFEFFKQACTGPLVVVFVCNELKLVVELFSDTQLESTHSVVNRTRHFENQGFKVARFCHYQVMNDILSVVDQLGVAVRQSKKALAMSQIACSYLVGKSNFSNGMT
jgi:very-short-patch-repair endonuclease